MLDTDETPLGAVQKFSLQYHNGTDWVDLPVTQVIGATQNADGTFRSSILLEGETSEVPQHKVTFVMPAPIDTEKVRYFQPSGGGTQLMPDTAVLSEVEFWGNANSYVPVVLSMNNQDHISEANEILASDIQFSASDGGSQAPVTADKTWSVNSTMQENTYRSFKYDMFDRLIAVYFIIGGQETIQAEYFYDAFGRRVKKYLYEGGLANEIISYTYDGERVIEEKQDGKTTKQFIWSQDTDELIAYNKKRGITEGLYYYRYMDFNQIDSLLDTTGSSLEHYSLWHFDFSIPTIYHMENSQAVYDEESRFGNPFMINNMWRDDETAVWSEYSIDRILGQSGGALYGYVSDVVRTPLFYTPSGHFNSYYGIFMQNQGLSSDMLYNQHVAKSLNLDKMHEYWENVGGITNSWSTVPKITPWDLTRAWASATVTGYMMLSSGAGLVRGAAWAARGGKALWHARKMSTAINLGKQAVRSIGPAWDGISIGQGAISFATYSGFSLVADQRLTWGGAIGAGLGGSVKGWFGIPIFVGISHYIDSYRKERIDINKIAVESLIGLTLKGVYNTKHVKLKAKSIDTKMLQSIKSFKRIRFRQPHYRQIHSVTMSIARSLVDKTPIQKVGIPVLSSLSGLSIGYLQNEKTLKDIKYIFGLEE